MLQQNNWNVPQAHEVIALQEATRDFVGDPLWTSSSWDPNGPFRRTWSWDPDDDDDGDVHVNVCWCFS